MPWPPTCRTVCSSRWRSASRASRHQGVPGVRHAPGRVEADPPSALRGLADFAGRSLCRGVAYDLTTRCRSDREAEAAKRGCSAAKGATADLLLVSYLTNRRPASDWSARSRSVAGIGFAADAFAEPELRGPRSLRRRSGSEPPLHMQGVDLARLLARPGPQAALPGTSEPGCEHWFGGGSVVCRIEAGSLSAQVASVGLVNCALRSIAMTERAPPTCKEGGARCV